MDGFEISRLTFVFVFLPILRTRASPVETETPRSGAPTDVVLPVSFPSIEIDPVVQSKTKVGLCRSPLLSAVRSKTAAPVSLSLSPVSSNTTLTFSPAFRTLQQRHTRSSFGEIGDAYNETKTHRPLELSRSRAPSLSLSHTLLPLLFVTRSPTLQPSPSIDCIASHSHS
jgi:hypothetical protein